MPGPTRVLKARYHVRGPFIEPVTYKKCSMDPVLKSLVSEEVTEDLECFHVRFPQGHSLRVVGRERLVELKLHLKPRIVDMATGDVVEVGGDPYEFGNDPFRDEEMFLVEDDDTTVDPFANERKAKRVSSKAKSQE